LLISLLIIFDTLLLRPSLHCNTPLQFTALHPTTRHYTSLHFTKLHFTTLYPTTLHYTSQHTTQLHFTTLRYTSPNYTLLHFTQLLFTTLHPSTLYYTSPNYTSPHFTTLHPTTLHYTSLHTTQLHFTTIFDNSLPLIYTSLTFHLVLRVYISYLITRFIPQRIQLQAQVTSPILVRCRESARNHVRLGRRVSAVRAVGAPVLVCLRNSCGHVTKIGGA
jgi:hypothetical protein